MSSDTSRPILLVEDNPDDRELTLMSLQDAGILNPIELAADGVEALEYLFGDAELPVLVILDLKLPRLDGFDVLTRIRREERTRALPVVILTSSDADEDIGRSYEIGVNSYVRKPVEWVAFAQAVKQLGLYWLLLNEPLPR